MERRVIIGVADAGSGLSGLRRTTVVVVEQHIVGTNDQPSAVRLFRGHKTPTRASAMRQGGRDSTPSEIMNAGLLYKMSIGLSNVMLVDRYKWHWLKRRFFAHLVVRNA